VLVIRWYKLERLGYDDLHCPLGVNDLVLTPVVAGSGGDGLASIFIGAVLVGVSFLLPGSGLFGASAFGVFGPLAPSTIATLTSVGTAISAIGAGLILSGTSQLLSPQPVIPSLGQNRTAPGERTSASGPQGVSRAVSGQQSYLFTGPANTVGVGATVPLVYGKLLIGSHLISSRVEVADESDPTSDFFAIPGGSSILVNSEKPTGKFKSHNGLRTRRWYDNQVIIKDDNSDKGYKRRIVNDNLDFDNIGQSKSTSDMRDYDQDDNEFGNFQVFFEIDKGLSRSIGGKLVPAFLTYEITIKKDNYPGDSPLFCKVRGTIQGLLSKNQNYKWCHAITYGESGREKSDTTVRVKYRILDTDADSPNGRLRIRGVGYNMFRQDSENRTEDLVTEA